MTPRQFLSHIREQEPAPAYLFIGPEPYQRDWCRRALLERVLPEPELRQEGLVRYDLQETPLAAVIDDACSLSLFVTRRVIWASNAEAVVPGPRPTADVAPSEAGTAAQALARYLKDPTPGVVLVFEASRFQLTGDDKKRADRVRSFYAAVAEHVEFGPLTQQQARSFAENLARKAGLQIGPAELDLLVESLGGEAARIAAEIDKLRLWAASGKAVTARDIAELVPDARATTIFALVEALGRRDRLRALEVLDTLIRQSEYLPLALSFLGAQFRAALAAKEAGLRSPEQIRSRLSQLGMNIWPSKAVQIHHTVSSFTQEQIAAALSCIFLADRALREARPDDRVIMEDFILRLAA